MLAGRQRKQKLHHAVRDPRTEFWIENIYSVHKVSMRETQHALSKKIAQDRVADGGWYAWFWTRFVLDARLTG